MGCFPVLGFGLFAGCVFIRRKKSLFVWKSQTFSSFLGLKMTRVRRKFSHLCHLWRVSGCCNCCFAVFSCSSSISSIFSGFFLFLRGSVWLLCATFWVVFWGLFCCWVVVLVLLGCGLRRFFVTSMLFWLVVVVGAC